MSESARSSPASEFPPDSKLSGEPAAKSASNDPTKTSQPFLVTWARTNGFMLGMGMAVGLAFLFPRLGSRNGGLHPALVSNIGIAIILFLQGISLAWEKMRAALATWRMHVIIQAFTFLVFPIVGFSLYELGPVFWPSEPGAIRDGLLYLCVLPSTISTSVVLTSVAGGNTPGALFNAALSNIAGVILTPLFVHLLMKASGHAASIGPLLLKVTLLTLLPFAIGLFLRRYWKNQVDANKRWVNRICNTIVLFIVYTAFCDSVESKIWTVYGVSLTLKLLGLVILLFGGMSLLIYAVCRLAQLQRADAIATYFCSVKKTLAMGVPLAVLIFGQRSDLSLILLPTMFYHPFQLLVNGLLANQWAKKKSGYSGFESAPLCALLRKACVKIRPTDRSGSCKGQWRACAGSRDFGMSTCREIGNCSEIRTGIDFCGRRVSVASERRNGGGKRGNRSFK